MRQRLKIGYIPILDHLILGVADFNDGAYFEYFELEAVRFENLPTLANALQNKEIDGAFCLYPIMENLYRQGLDIKIVLLGHREGQVLVVNNKINSIEDLRGKTILIPHEFSTHHILLQQILQQNGLNIKKDVTIKIGYEKITDVLDYLEKDEIQAFIIAEPLGTEARRKKIGKILALSHNIKLHHIDCVLVLNSAVLNKNQEAIKEFIGSLVKAGMFINDYPRQAAEIGEKFLGWPSKVLLEALTHDFGHILFWDLLPRMEDFQELENTAVDEMHLWNLKIDLKNFIFPQLAQAAYREWVIDTRKETKDKGSSRSLPGSFQEANNKFQSHFDSPIFLSGIKIIYPGDKYPSKITKIERPNEPYSILLNNFIGKSEVVINSVLPEFKAYAFVGSRDGIVPEKIILKLNKEEADKCLKALTLGEEILSVEDYEEKSAEKIMTDLTKKVVMLKQDKIFWLAINFKVFKFLTLLLRYND